MTEYEKLHALVLHREGKTPNYIANDLGRSRGCIREFLRNPNGYGTKRSTGRPPKVTNTMHRLLIRAARTGSFTAAELVERHSLPVGPRRVC